MNRALLIKEPLGSTLGKYTLVPYIRMNVQPLIPTETEADEVLW
jgi:hypothetical protein